MTTITEAQKKIIRRGNQAISRLRRPTPSEEMPALVSAIDQANRLCIELGRDTDPAGFRRALGTKFCRELGI